MSQEQYAELRFNRVENITSSPDGEKIAVTTYQYSETSVLANGTVRILNTATRQQMSSLEFSDIEREGFYDTIEWGADSASLHVLIFHQGVRVYDVFSGQMIRFYPLETVVPDEFRFNRTSTQALGSKIFAGTNRESIVTIHEVDTGRLLFSAVYPYSDDLLIWVRWNPDETRFITITANGTIRLYDATTFVLIAQHAVPNSGYRGVPAAWSPDGNRLLVSGTDTYRELRLIDPLTGAVLRNFPGWRSRPFWNSVTNEVYSQEGNLINVWDMNSLTVARQISNPFGDDADISVLSFTPTGQVIFGGENEISTFDPDLSIFLTILPQPIPYTRLGFDIQPSDVLTGSVIAPHIQVSLRDDADAIVRRAGILITLEIDSNPSDGTLNGTLTRLTDAQGVATFDDIRIDRPGQGYSLIAAVERDTDVNSARFTVHETIGFG